MRSSWKGSITFGLVSVPVALYKATEEHSGLSLHMVHATDGGRIKLRRFCEAEDQEVPFEEIAKGFETDDGRQAVITKDDLEGLPLPSKRIIDVIAFVDAVDIDPLRLATPYYVGVAAKAPAKPYVLLREALTRAGKVAVTKVTLSTRESLAVLRVVGDLLVLQTMLWPDEIRPPEGLAPQGESEVRPQELKMARSLMDTLSEDFRLEDLHDQYAAALKQVIEAKLEGAPTAADATAPVGGGQAMDLMAALRSSVEAARQAHPKAVEPQQRATTRRTTAAKPRTAKSTSASTTSAGTASARTAGAGAGAKAPAKKTAPKKTTTSRKAP